MITRTSPTHEHITHLAYPGEAFPDKVTSLNLDKSPVVEGRLDAIKGQYLPFWREEGCSTSRAALGYRVRWTVS